MLTIRFFSVKQNRKMIKNVLKRTNDGFLGFDKIFFYNR